MYSISQTLDDIIHQNTRIVKPRFSYVGVGTIDNKYIQSWTINYTLNESEQWVWGGVPSQQLTLNLIKADNSFYRPQPWTDAQIIAEVGIYKYAEPYDGTEDIDDDDNFIFIPLGVFRPAKNGINETNLSVVLTCFDDMVMTDYDVIGTEGTYTNKTVEDLLDIFETLYGYDWSSISVGEKAQIMKYETTANTTMRELIQWVAIQLAGFAVFDRNGNLTFKRQKNRTYDTTLDRSDYFTLTYRENEATYIEKFNAEQIFVREHEEEEPYTGTFTVSANSGITYGLACPIFTDATQTQQALNNGVANWIKNVIPFTCQSAGMPHIDVGDILRIENRDGTYMYFAVARHTLTYQNRTLTSEFECLAFEADEVVGGSVGNNLGAVVRQLQESKTYMFDSIKASSASISNLQTEKLDATLANIDQAHISTASIQYLASQIVDADQISAICANLGYLTSTQIDANYASINYLQSSYASLGYLQSSYATIDSLNSSYANIDLANISQAGLQRLFVDTGILTDATISTASITGMLNSVSINADKITAGTLNVNRLNIYDDNGIVYAINAQNVSSAILGNLTTYEATHQLHGNDIIAQSITANKIAADTITANEIAANTITAGQIAANTITGNEILANTITANKLDVQTLSAITANMGTVSAGCIKGDNADFDLNSGIVRLGSTDSFYTQVETDGLAGYKQSTSVYKVGMSSYGKYQVRFGSWTAPSSSINAFSIGQYNYVSGDNGVAIGHNSTAAGTDSVALGWSNYSGGYGSLTGGCINTNNAQYAVAFGYDNDISTNGKMGVALGEKNSVYGQHGVAIGYANSAQEESVALGKNAYASTARSMALGFNVTADQPRQVVIGSGATASTARFVVGVGDANDVSPFDYKNGLEIDNYGNAKFRGSVQEYGDEFDGTDVITMNSGYTLCDATAIRVGRLCQLSISFVKTSTLAWPATGDISDMSIGTLKTDFRPRWIAHFGHGGMTSGCDGTIERNGAITCRRLPPHASNSTISAKASTFLVRCSFMTNALWKKSD